MERKKLLEGIVYGNPEILKVQVRGAAAAKAKARHLREAIADALMDLDGLNHGLSNKVVADELNARRLQTAQNKKFTARSVSEPLRDAMQILRDRAGVSEHGEQAASNDIVPPGWGRF